MLLDQNFQNILHFFHYLSSSSFSFNILLTIPGFAFPLVFCIICPTKNPIILTFPDLYSYTSSIEYDAEKLKEDDIMEAALNAGAEDIVNEDGVITVTTDPGTFNTVLEALQNKGFESMSAEVGMIPDAYVPVDASTAGKVQKLVDRLEEDDDVQNVYHTAEYPDDFAPEE